MKPVLEIQNISKKFRIHHENQPYLSLRDSLASVFKRGTSSTEDFFALSDVSFNVNSGESIGIIGKNGAGKSTLLKILSKITPPTSGKIISRGRIASLLEVGTGFHAELSGRENIFLNGSILGMKRSEIQRNFDAIIDFAGVEKFLDTPLKHYSSGMQLRLAFAVAAFLENEILIIDEVLAVGDAEFQKKCMGKMEDVSRNEGRTVLFVSHNMKAVQQLCKRIVWIHNGKVHSDGLSRDISDNYLKTTSVNTSYNEIKALIDNLPSDPDFKLENICITQNKVEGSQLYNGESFQIEIHYRVLKQCLGLRVYFDLCDNDENILIRSFNDENLEEIPVVMPGNYVSTATIPSNLLAAVSYELRIHAGIYNVKMCTPELGIRIPIDINSSNKINIAYSGDTIRSKISPFINWKNLFITT
ncbi:MAG: Teichoic-acid-transporting ATPase [Bacteroidetes bacterium]|jgi:lipopolysaccharide transport system ATP-binding protein|nr:Teichoic-acid-transporting ATPase [Bacteroidota bacterium]MDF2452255.1 Teichoic-acid-transporting ATPase [Bacteroidota bacterium]